MSKKILLLLLIACAISIFATFVSAQTCGWQNCSAVTLSTTTGSTTLASVSSANANFTLTNTNVVAICGNGTGNATCLNGSARVVATCNSTVNQFCDPRTLNINFSNVTNVTNATTNITKVIISTGSYPARLGVLTDAGQVCDGVFPIGAKVTKLDCYDEYNGDAITDIFMKEEHPDELYAMSATGAGVAKVMVLQRNMGGTNNVDYQQGVTIGNTEAATDPSIGDVHYTSTFISAGTAVLVGMNAGNRAVYVTGYTGNSFTFQTGVIAGDQVDPPSMVGASSVVGITGYNVNAPLTEETPGIKEGYCAATGFISDFGNGMGANNGYMIQGYDTFPALVTEPSKATFKGPAGAQLSSAGGKSIRTNNKIILTPSFYTATNELVFIRLEDDGDFGFDDIDVVETNTNLLVSDPVVEFDVNADRDKVGVSGRDGSAKPFAAIFDSRGESPSLVINDVKVDGTSETVAPTFMRMNNPTIIGWQTSNSSIIGVLMGSNVVSAYEIEGMFVDDAGFLDVQASGGHYGDYAYYVLGGRDLNNKTVYLDWKNTTLHLEATNPNGTTRFTTDKQVVIATYNPDINILNFQLNFQSFNGSFNSANGTCIGCTYDGANQGPPGWCQAEVEKVWGMFQSYNLTITLTADRAINMTNLELVCTALFNVTNGTSPGNSNCSGLSNYTDTNANCFTANVPAGYGAYATQQGNAVYINLTALAAPGYNLTSMPFGSIAPDATCEQIACYVIGTWEPGNTQEFTVNKTITATAI